MRKRELLSAIALTLIIASSAFAQADATGLEWLDTTDADQLFAEAVRARRFELLEVCGYSCGTPPVGFAQYEHCYSGSTTVRRIDPTGDAIQTDDHLRLKIRALGIAQAHNVKMLALLDSVGRRKCPVGEDWDELFSAFSRLADSVPRDPYYSSAIAYPGDRAEDFQFHVPNEAHLGPELYARLCRLPPQFGIRRPVALVVTSGDVNRNPKRHGNLTCREGRVAA